MVNYNYKYTITALKCINKLVSFHVQFNLWSQRVKSNGSGSLGPTVEWHNEKTNGISQKQKKSQCKTELQQQGRISSEQ